MTEDSEFGHGYATCLIQFLFHRSRLARDIGTYTSAKIPRSMALEMWANGSSDHLYDLTRPPRGVSNEDWKVADQLARRALDIGHGFRESSASTPEECEALLDTAERLLKDIGVETFIQAVGWDVEHGLDPDPGTWSCVEQMKEES